MEQYRFTPGFQARAVKPAAAAAELERVKAENGTLTASAVFEASRPKTAPLHDEFVWDGKEAIKQLGEMRARQIIRAVVVVKPEQEQAPQRVYVHIPNATKHTMPGTYERMEIVANRVDLYERALIDLQRKVDSAIYAIEELKRAAQGTDNAERLAAIGLAVQGFGAVREALALLK